MSAPSNWRSSADYAYASDLDPAGLAWEFLRRNPEFRADCLRAQALIAADAPAAAVERDRLAGRWGVHFPP